MKDSNVFLLKKTLKKESEEEEKSDSLELGESGSKVAKEECRLWQIQAKRIIAYGKKVLFVKNNFDRHYAIENKVELTTLSGKKFQKCFKR